MKSICFYTHRPVAAAFMMLLMGCDKTPMPTSDSTPPTLSWVVRKDGGSNQNLPVTSTLNAAKGDKFSVTLVLEDPQGMKKIALGGEGSYSCDSGNLSQSKSYSGAVDAQNLGPDSNGKVLTKIIQSQNFDTNDMSCESGTSFAGGSYEFNGEGENYFNGIAIGKLTITVSP